MAKKSILIICFVILILTILIYYPSTVHDYDVWYHLKFGEHFVTNHTFKLDHSIFSWTKADPNWRYGIWVGSSILYLAYKLFDVYGLYIIQWLIFLTIIWLYLRFIKLIGDSLGIIHILSLLLVFIALNLTALYIKPELFTTLLFTITAFIYFHSKVTGKHFFLLYPGILFLWVNTHGGYLIGLVFITLCLAGEWANYLKLIGFPKKSLVYLTGSVLASYIAVLFNPYGFSYHVGIIKTFITPDYSNYALQVFAWIDMWRYLFPVDFAFRFSNTAWILMLMISSFLALLIYAYIKKGFLDITLILLSLVFWFQGMQQARITIFLPIIWMFAMLYVLKKIDLLHIKKRFAVPGLILFMAVSIYIADISLIVLDDRSWFGGNIKVYNPEKEVQFIKTHKLQGPIFNDYLIGGYLIWSLYPDYKIFIDPRYGPYWKEVGPDYFNLLKNLDAENLQKFIMKYPFKIVLLHMREMPLITMFVSLPDWRLLYFNNTAVIIVHQSVFERLTPEILSIDISADRFSDLKNPLVLSTLFNFYITLNRNQAKRIAEIYHNNVSIFFRYKSLEEINMKTLISGNSN